MVRLRDTWCPFLQGLGLLPELRRPADAAHLVEAVLPRVPVRQWVLTLPYVLRYRLAWNHGLTRAVLGVYARVLQDFYIRGAHRRGIGGGRTGMLTVVQRFGSGVKLNVHFHTGSGRVSTDVSRHRDFQSVQDDEEPVSSHPPRSFERAKKIYDDLGFASERQLDV